MIRDLRINGRRTFLVVLAIGIGLVGAGAVLDSYSILSRELQKNYLATKPAAASVMAENVDESLLAAVRAIPGIAGAEARRKVVGRIMLPGGEWKPAWYFVVPDFDGQGIDTFLSDKGAWPPADGEVLIERVALQVLPAALGDTVIARIPLGGRTKLRFSGTSYAPGLAPAMMERVVYCFVTPRTFAMMGGRGGLDEIKIRVSGDGLDAAFNRKMGYKAAAVATSSGHALAGVQVPVPGRHPHYTQMMTLLYPLEALGFMAFALSAVLAANMISSIMSRQMKEIGIMKALGGSRARIMGIYYGMVALMGAAALAFALPLAALLGTLFARFAAGMLNFRLYDESIPFAVYAAQIAIGMLTPLLVSSLSILKGTRIPAREAFSDYGIDQRGLGRGALDGILERVGGVSRPLLISLRNAFRKKNRMILTMAALALGGAVFITAMNVNSSLGASIESRYNASNYDIQLKLSKAYPADVALAAARAVPGLRRAEAWGGARVRRVGKDGAADLDFAITAPPYDSKMLSSSTLVAGRWLRPDDTSTIVINQRLALAWPDVGVGSRVSLRIGGADSEWTVAGIVREFLVEPGAYANYLYLSKISGQEGLTKNIVLIADDRGKAAEVGEKVEAALVGVGVDVAEFDDLATFIEAVREHLLVLALALAAITLMVVVVGGIGLTSSMSANVLERTREIGVMRAIGARTGTILGIVVSECAIIGGLSWAVAVMVSWPVSAFLTDRFGMMFFESPLTFAVSPLGLIVWIGLSVVFAAMTGFIPALRAAKMPVREAIAYE